MKTLLKKLPALALLIGAVTLLQIHAMAWWTQYDPATGWLWSVVIEAGAIWLWSARSLLRNSIALFATALALIAPLYQLAAPMLDGQRATQQAATTLPARTAAAQAQIETLTASLAQYNDNSAHRGGWAPLIASTQQQLATARADLTALQTEAATPAPVALAVYLPLAMQMIALCLLQCLVVLTTRTVFAGSNDQAPKLTTQTAAPAAGDDIAAGGGDESRSIPTALADMALMRPKPDATR
ncbi:hypothetical protein [Thalassolituus oleivorans]|uniref:hypothetical protein n=1 Tax=Thalassolituus oleivorans TaxID=187493 RepID=UPI0023F3922B|nr:hypothetical protein [Thalassolituus oleivorans]